MKNDDPAKVTFPYHANLSANQPKQGAVGRTPAWRALKEVLMFPEHQDREKALVRWWLEWTTSAACLTTDSAVRGTKAAKNEVRKIRREQVARTLSHLLVSTPGTITEIPRLDIETDVRCSIHSPSILMDKPIKPEAK